MTTSSMVGRGEAGVYLQQSTGRRRGPPWTGRLSITGQHTYSSTPKGNVERPINLIVMFLDCGRKLWASYQQCYQLRHRVAQDDPLQFKKKKMTFSREQTHFPTDRTWIVKDKLNFIFINL
ncbi:hypothetical protein AMECASPLE_028324 [Ameca splendens]|uniref:Uncharacterized protein n=1 Tax=Ameca splendens TaxID=208324 RepID=A0ABV1ACD0_9TELE